MKIYACPRCGSTDINMGSIGSGITYGLTSWNEICRNCGFRGHPLIFKSKNDYQAFLEDIKSKHDQADQEENESPSLVTLSKKDREVVESLKEFETDPGCDKKCIDFKQKNWWPEIVFAIIFSIVLSILTFPNLLISIPEFASAENMIFTISFFLLGTFLNFIWIIILILIIEYVAITLKYKFIKN